MFSGIIETLGTVVSDIHDEKTRLVVRAEALVGELGIGDSVSVNGCCLTVVATDAEAFSVDVMPVTKSRTTLDSLKAGDSVNLEAAMRYGDRVGGHMVTGHVDAVAEISRTQQDGNATRVRITVPGDLAPLIAAQGCVAVDGISLTVVAADSEGFTVALIPHTLDVTNTGSWRIGTKVNLEVDMMARYIARILNAQSPVPV